MTMRTAIYCRVSTPGQKHTTSLPEQERINRAHTAQLGWDVSEPHVYREVEGGEDLYRPQMDRLWDAIIRHEIDAVVIDVLDRLSRDEGDCGAFYHHCDRYGVRVELASEDIDETENGRNLRTLSGMMARMERVDIRRRTQRGRKARVSAGKLLPASFPLYGYVFGDAQHTCYIVDPESGWVVVFIFESVADGVPIRRLVRELEQRGIPTPFQVLAQRGQLPAGRRVNVIWHRRTIQRILHHPAYWGQHSAYRWANTATKVRPAETGITIKVRQMRERAVDDPTRVALPNACPALVSAELAARVHARLAENKAQSAGRNPDPLATLWRGLAVCGHCGGRLNTGLHRHAQGRRYECSNVLIDAEGRRTRCPGRAPSMTASLLDPPSWADVRAWLSEEENVARFLADWEQDNISDEQSISSRVQAADAQIALFRGKMDGLGESIADATSREGRLVLQQKLDQYGERLRAEEVKRERLLHEAREASTYAEASQGIRERIGVVAARSATMTRAQQRDTLRALGAQLTLWRADHVHPDGWPQRYKITLHWTGFSGQPTTLPPATSVRILSQASCCRRRVPA